MTKEIYYSILAMIYLLIQSIMIGAIFSLMWIYLFKDIRVMLNFDLSYWRITGGIWMLKLLFTDLTLLASAMRMGIEEVINEEK